MNLLAKIAGRELHHIVCLSVVGTLGCVAVSFALDFLLHRFADPQLSRLLLAILVPLVVGAPLIFFLGLKLRDLSLLRQMYAQRISHDSLTECLNGPTFSAFVDAYVGVRGAEGKQTKGALLVVDADHFRSVNERFGHGWGDQALRIIAETIRAAVRSGDLVGRLGGQEFGVFLPGADRKNAEDIAERIRASVSEVFFVPAASKRALTVSVGAVLFEDELEFEELYRAADQQLLSAKAAGRDRVEYHRILPPLPGASARPSSLH